ncbi:MAG: nucleotidyltransferase family protein [Bacteroidales bacterium]|nr:nucleotidyltransferase family protein [Bacteroidales bacterium]
MRELLLLLCRYPFDEANRATLSKLLSEVQDWHKLVELVNAHGIIALAAYNIREARLEKIIPKDAMAVLDNGRMQCMIRNTWLVQRWKEVNKILTDAEIKHVLLKGMALEHKVYGAKGLRQMSDNDILVKKNNVMKAWFLLQEHGFVPDMTKSPLYFKIITEIGNHIPALRKENYSVEIHHRLFYEPERNESLDEAIDNAVMIEIEGEHAFVLKDDIHLDFLKKHLQHHLISGNAELKLFNDIELISPGSAPPFPAGFLLNPNSSENPIQKKRSYRTHFYSLPWNIRFRFLIGDIFPSLKWMKKRYKCNGIKVFLYYPERIGKLIWLI